MSVKLITFFLNVNSSPPHLTHPQILPSGAWGEGETKMAPYDNDAPVQLTSNESTDSVRTELSL